MTTPDYIADAIKEAATRHSGAMYPHEIQSQYAEIQARPVPKSEMVGYVAPDEKAEADTGALTPSQKRGMKLFAGAAGTVSLCAAFIQQAATGAFNQYFGWAILAAAGVFVVSGVAGAVGGGSIVSNDGHSSRSGGAPVVNNYYQNNFQGPNGQQTNQR